MIFIHFPEHQRITIGLDSVTAETDHRGSTEIEMVGSINGEIFVARRLQGDAFRIKGGGWVHPITVQAIERMTREVLHDWQEQAFPTTAEGEILVTSPRGIRYEGFDLAMTLAA